LGDAREWTVFDERTSLPLLAGQGAGTLVTSEGGLFQIELDEIEARPGTTFRISVTSPVYRTGAVSGPLSSETIRGTNLVRLSFNHPDPNEAARILNTITDVFFELNLARRSEESQKTLSFLKAELPKLRQELDQADLALNQFRASPRTVDVTYELQQLLGASTSIETRLLEFELRRRELLLRYDESYPAVQAIDDQKVGLLEQRAALFEKITKLPAVQQDFIQFTLDVEVNKQMYISLLNSEQQLEIAKAGTVGNVAIIDAAITPRVPTKPQKTQIVVIGLAIGLLLGFALTQLLAVINKVVRDPKKLELETGVPTLAIMPLDGEQNGRFLSGDHSVFMLSKEAPEGAGVEALRSLRTALMFALSEKPRSKVVLITSAVPSQGKSFISANLSYLLGATGKRTLLIDADIRKSSLQRYFDCDHKGPGLSSVLKGEKTVDEVLIKGAYENLDFLSAGPRVRNAGDLLAGEAIQSIINDIAQHYDFVVIDSPPLLPVHDARALGKAADVSLFVARQDAVSLTEVQDAIDVFNKSGNFFDGVVFNGFVPSRVRYGYGYGYGYGGKYGRYGRYGKYATYGKYGKYYDSNADVESSTEPSTEPSADPGTQPRTQPRTKK
jgi:tyrosine-protein kinase Etk/Wzc